VLAPTGPTHFCIKFSSINAFKHFGVIVFLSILIGVNSSFYMQLSDTTKTGGFFLDNSKDANPKFCIGGCDL
jgi:hypothetical protein